MTMTKTRFLFIATYYGKTVMYKIIATDKQEAIKIGYKKATKKLLCSNCELNFRSCNID